VEGLQLIREELRIREVVGEALRQGRAIGLSCRLQVMT
jgi:hypothetical protein